MSAGEARSEQGCALVTGASRGVGAAIARALATDGWSVAVNYRADAEGARGVAEEIAAGGGQAFEIEADVADEGSVERMFDTVEERLGPVLVLVNNAGARHDRLLQGLSREEWGRIVDVNLHGAFHTTKRAIGPMSQNRFGRIINVSSISATRPQPAQSAYAASKAGVEALTRTVAQEPREVAAVASFLASEEAGYISGTVITMDGGFSAGLGTGGQYWRPKAQTSGDA